MPFIVSHVSNGKLLTPCPESPALFSPGKSRSKSVYLLPRKVSGDDYYQSDRQVAGGVSTHIVRATANRNRDSGPDPTSRRTILRLFPVTGQQLRQLVIHKSVIAVPVSRRIRTSGSTPRTPLRSILSIPVYM